MKEEKLGQETAFPTKPQSVVIGNESYTYFDEKLNQCVGYRNIFGEVQNNGMSKRFYAACMAMQGLLANPQFRVDVGGSPKKIIEYAFSQADELLKQEGL